MRKAPEMRPLWTDLDAMSKQAVDFTNLPWWHITRRLNVIIVAQGAIMGALAEIMQNQESAARRQPTRKDA